MIDVAVIGGGVMGAAASRALALQGREVMVFERSTIGHHGGSSHGSVRIWRHSYRDPAYVRMMTDALPLWRALEDEAGEQLLSVTAARNIGPDLDELEAAMARGGAPSERRGDEVFDPLAGAVYAEAAWRALMASASSHGAIVHEHADASLALDGDEVLVRAGNMEVRARAAVVTAGGWVRDVLAPVGLDVPVRVTQETVSYWRVADLEAVGVVIDWGTPLRYAVPSPDGVLKIGEHIAGYEAPPGSQGPVDEASIERARAWLERVAPGAQPERVSAETCFYTSTDDQRFIIERHGPIVIGSPCSGHGFKFAPLIGERLAALV